MRYGNINGRLSLIANGKALDVEKASNGQFGSDPDGVYENWEEFLSWTRGQSLVDALPFTDDEVGPPVLRPAQVFAIGLNYDATRAKSSGSSTPTPSSTKRRCAEWSSRSRSPPSSVAKRCVPALAFDWTARAHTNQNSISKLKKLDASNHWEYLSNTTG